MNKRRALMDAYPRLCAAGGLLMAAAAVLGALVSGRLITAYAFNLCVPLLIIVLACQVLDKHLEIQIIENIYGWYRGLLKSLAAACMLSFFLTVTRNEWAGLFLTSLILWVGGLNMRSVRWRLLALGAVFLAAMTAAFPVLTMPVLLLMLVFGSGMLLILYGIHYQDKRGMASGRAWYDLAELGMLIAAGTAVPVLLGFSAAWPMRAAFVKIRSEYAVFREAVAADAVMDSGLLLDIGILIILIVLLVLVWRKMMERRTEEQAPIPEEVFGVIGRKRSLNLEPRRTRRYPDSWAGRIMRLYYEFQDFLHGQGIRREPCVTPAEFALHLQQRNPAETENITALTMAFLQARFSLHAVSEDDFKGARKAARALRAGMLRPDEEESRAMTPKP